MCLNPYSGRTFVLGLGGKFNRIRPYTKITICTKFQDDCFKKSLQKVIMSRTLQTSAQTHYTIATYDKNVIDSILLKFGKLEI